MESKHLGHTGTPGNSGGIPVSGTPEPERNGTHTISVFRVPVSVPATPLPDLGKLSWHGGKPVIRMAESIPARLAGIAWRWDDAGVHDVIVCRMRTPTGVTAEWLRATEGPDGRPCTGGACYSDWMRPGHYSGPIGHTTPEGTFASWLQDGFTSPAEAVRALAQIAKVEECGWARLMLTGINAPEETA